MRYYYGALACAQVRVTVRVVVSAPGHFFESIINAGPRQISEKSRQIRGAVAAYSR